MSRWRQISDALRSEIEKGRIAPGDRLPSELELAGQFGVHRHTVRRALQALAAEGQVRVRHGRGTFACPPPLRYALGRRISFTANVTDQGRVASRRIERLETLRAPAPIAQVLELTRGAKVLRAITVAAADGVPLARGQHHFPLQRLPKIEQALVATAGISAALASVGIVEVRRARTRIATRVADEAETEALALAPLQPVLVTEGLDVDTGGRPVQFGITAFCGHRVELEI